MFRNTRGVAIKPLAGLRRECDPVNEGKFLSYRLPKIIFEGMLTVWVSSGYGILFREGHIFNGPAHGFLGRCP